jgi:hypothetical protein
MGLNRFFRELLLGEKGFSREVFKIYGGSSPQYKFVA